MLHIFSLHRTSFIRTQLCQQLFKKKPNLLNFAKTSSFKINERFILDAYDISTSASMFFWQKTLQPACDWHRLIPTGAIIMFDYRFSVKSMAVAVATWFPTRL